MIRGCWALLLTLLATNAQSDLLLTDAEVAQTLSFGPWPPSFEADPSNRVSGNVQAIALGRDLFADPILSQDGTMSCASCHEPASAFAAHEPRAQGQSLLDRNSPSLRNLAGLRWYGWGGKSDSLWAASLHPITDPREMANTAPNWAQTLAASTYMGRYEDLFGAAEAHSPQAVLVNTGKVLAAYQETLVTSATPFDRFRDALAAGDMARASLYPKEAQLGLKTFLGRGNCAFCHNGPHFSNNEFHNAGVPYFLTATEVDPGRFAGLKSLFESPYTQAGDWSDDPLKRNAWPVQNVREKHSDFGAFRTPGLRGVAETAPYMHDGSLADLEAVVRHYSEIDPERLHADGEAILKPLHLTDVEVTQLIAFLTSLSETR